MKKYNTTISADSSELSTEDFRLLIKVLLPQVILDETNTDVQYLVSIGVLEDSGEIVDGLTTPPPEEES